MKYRFFLTLFFFSSACYSNDNSLPNVEIIRKEKLDNGLNIYFFVNIEPGKSTDKKDIKEVISETILGGKNHLAYLGNWALEYKFVVPLCTFVGIYGITFYKLYKLNKTIFTKDSWSNWKSEIPFEKLLSIQSKNLANDLLSDIQKRYLNQSHPNDFITPMVLFSTEIEKDIANLELYLKILKAIKFLKLVKIFPIKDDNEAQEKLNKLIYLKNIFSNFSVELNRQRLMSEAVEVK